MRMNRQFRKMRNGGSLFAKDIAHMTEDHKELKRERDQRLMYETLYRKQRNVMLKVANDEGEVERLHMCALCKGVFLFGDSPNNMPCASPECDAVICNETEWCHQEQAPCEGCGTEGHCMECTPYCEGCETFLCPECFDHDEANDGFCSAECKADYEQENPPSSQDGVAQT